MKQIKIKVGMLADQICTVVEESQSWIKCQIPENFTTVTLPKKSANGIKYYEDYKDLSENKAEK